MEQKYLEKKNKAKRKNVSLTREEWLTFFFFPILNSGPLQKDDPFFKTEIDRFEKYGFENKYNEAQKVKSYGIIFWFVVLILVIIGINFF